jgi:hypothetical protein
MKKKPEEYFRRELEEILIRRKSFFFYISTVLSEALLTSYHVACRIAEIAATAILPVVTDMIKQGSAINVFSDFVIYRWQITRSLDGLPMYWKT